MWATTHQYGVPMKESLLCKVLVFLADTPKSAGSRGPRQKKKKNPIIVSNQGIYIVWLFLCKTSPSAGTTCHQLLTARGASVCLSLGPIYRGSLQNHQLRRLSNQLRPSFCPKSAFIRGEERRALSLRPRDCWIIIICNGAAS